MNYSQLTKSELFNLKHENENTLWNAKYGDRRIYTPEVIRQAQNVVKECDEQLGKMDSLK